MQGFANLLRKKIILIVVFLTGASILTLEIVATRMLSPYFGNTIFTVTSVIGVVLTALSFGYYFGGIYADKFPRKDIFYRIIFYSGISVLLLQIINIFLIPLIAYSLSTKSGPVVTSLILFLLPSFLMGTLSPFAIKLQELENKKTGIGKLSGEIFFASTLGSIFGTFITGFYLIPSFGIQSIVVGVGILLIILGTLGLLPRINKLALAAVVFVLVPASLLRQIALDEIVYADDGIYEKIGVLETNYNSKPARILLQDASYGSGIFLGENEDMAFEYTKYYRLYKILGQKPKNVLFIGGGAYTMPSRMAKEVDNINIEVAEIEPQLIEIAEKYFNFENSTSIKNIIADGRRHLHDSANNYDLIFSDVYSSLYSIPAHFTTKEFFELSKSKLTENGIFMANIIGDMSRQKNSLLLKEIKTFTSVFPNSYIFAVDSPSISGSQNFVFVGLNNKNDLMALLEKSDDEYLKTIPQKRLNLQRFNLSEYKIMKDDFAPTEIMTAGLLERTSVKEISFSGEEAISLIRHQVDFGPRFQGSPAKEKVIEMITTEMEALNGNTKIQSWKADNQGSQIELKNIISSINEKADRRIILATHYDSKKTADKDRKDKNASVPGANDSASGTAVLMELARVISNSKVKPNIGIDFVFFDAEEGLEGKEWQPEGSIYFSENLKDIYEDKFPSEAIIVDMVCDKDLNIYKEENSMEYAYSLTNNLFSLANSMYPDNFINEVKYTIIDDHMPLNDKKIPSTLLIDFDYPYFHTTEDTADKCSPESLEKTGEVILDYIYSN